jgi:hypothetical protein
LGKDEGFAVCSVLAAHVCKMAENLTGETLKICSRI